MAASDASSANTPCCSWWPFLGVMAIALIVRGGALWAMREKLREDPDAYRQIAEGLLKTGTYTREVPLNSSSTPIVVQPTAYRPPLYPLLLTKIAGGIRVPLARIALVHLALGLATVALTWRLSREWIANERVWIAPLLVTIDPILLFQSAQVMTETLAAFLTVVCLWQAGRLSTMPNWWNAALLGGAIALASLCRPTYLPWLLPCLLVAALLSGTWHKRSIRVSAMFLAFVITISPWVVRNYQCFQRAIIATTHGGYTLWLANNDDFYDYLRSDNAIAWKIDEQAREETSIEAYEIEYAKDVLSETASDEMAKEFAIGTIRRRPEMFAYSCFVRIYYLWSPLPQKTLLSESTYRTLARLAVAAWYLGLYAMAVAGMVKLRRRFFAPPWIWGLTLCLVFTAVHAVYWSNLRMRAPLMPVVGLLAAAGASRRQSSPDA